MDITLLTFFNQTLTNPWLDVVMIALTIGGLALLPALGVVLWLRPNENKALFPAFPSALPLSASKKEPFERLGPSSRKTGTAILISLGLTLIVTLIFQYLALRPRPEAVRSILTTPNFPSYPSGHAAAAFAVALVISLTYRQLRWRGVALLGAMLIAYSRVYLGHHYPSDILGGSLLGASIGAACYGLFVLPHADWRWLLWPQIALAAIVSHMAYLDILPMHLLRWPMFDKVLHFLLFGAVVFWLNLWLQGRSLKLGRWAIPLAILLPLTIAVLDEGMQIFSPLRSADLGDLASDLGGMLFFWGLSYIVMLRKFQKNKSPKALYHGSTIN